MHSVFIKYVYTCTKPFSNFLNLSGVNGVNIFDVSFTRWPGGGHVIVSICDQGRGVWKGSICGDVINGQPQRYYRKKGKTGKGTSLKCTYTVITQTETAIVVLK